jgi:RHS repeat-associated protein
LNELGTITRSGTLTVAGTTTTNATSVTVNGVAASHYNDATFALGGFPLPSPSTNYTAGAQDALGRTDTNTITVNLPASVTCAYDLNGNLTSDGTRGFDYDDENQLIRVTVTNSWKTEFAYDGMMRRRLRTESTWNGTTWVTNSVTRYVYDGHLVIQERDTNNVPLVTYTRGADLSGSFQGAGGIGGLLARTDAGLQTAGFASAHSYYHADGNGDITVLINTNQAIVAKYLYDPFGNILSQSGPLADANLYRFSSKEFHKKSGLVYYLYRYAEPNFQRWLNRDPQASGLVVSGATDIMDNLIGPFESLNGPNLYQLVYNNPGGAIDPLGLDVWIIRDKCSKWGHEWAVGDNGDGTYWDSSKMPGKGPLAPANCPANIQFNPKSAFDPRNLNDPCLEIRRHVVTSAAVDRKTRDKAQRNANENKGRYDALGNNCRDYSKSLCDYAVGAKLGEMLGQ